MKGTSVHIKNIMELNGSVIIGFEILHGFRVRELFRTFEKRAPEHVSGDKRREVV